MADINVPQSTAQAFTEGISRGGVLIWARVSDEQASQVRGALRHRQSEFLATYTFG